MIPLGQCSSSISLVGRSRTGYCLDGHLSWCVGLEGAVQAELVSLEEISMSKGFAQDDYIYTRLLKHAISV